MESAVARVEPRKANKERADNVDYRWHHCLLLPETSARPGGASEECYIVPEYLQGVLPRPQFWPRAALCPRIYRC